jgi:hypothetical protein
MTDAKFVKRVWIVGRDIRNDKIGNKELLKHVDANVTRLENFASSSAFGANTLQRWAD